MAVFGPQSWHSLEMMSRLGAGRIRAPVTTLIVKTEEQNSGSSTEKGWEIKQEGIQWWPLPEMVILIKTQRLTGQPREWGSVPAEPDDASLELSE